MDWKTAGLAHTLSFDLKVDGDFAVADPGTLRLLLRDNVGTVITGYDRVALDDPTTQLVSVTIPAEVNVIADVLFETRYATFEYQVNGRHLSHKIIYRLNNFIPLQALPEDVRGLLGAEEKELPDADIDLLESYLLLLAEHGDDFNEIVLHANWSVVLHAAIRVLPGLPAKMLQTEQFNNAESQRMKVNFSSLRNTLERQLEESLQATLGAPALPLPSLLVVSTPTDPVTGE